MIGVQISEEYEMLVKQSIEAKSKAKKLKEKKAKEQQESLEGFSDDRFAYIAGYTSNGFPFGVTHEEMEDWDDDEDL